MSALPSSLRSDLLGNLGASRARPLPPGQSHGVLARRALRATVEGAKQLLTGLLLALLWLYQHLISSALHFAGGPSCGCRFFPTCSNYAVEAIRARGPLIGLFFAIKRLLRCSPLSPGGIDLVPLRRGPRPRCIRIISAKPTAP